MDCPKCGGTERRKDGFVRGRQRHQCKGCGYRYTVAQHAGTGDAAVRQRALDMYLEGLGFRSIGRLLGFSNVTVLNWIRAFGAQAAAVSGDAPVRVMEVDEMHSYVGSKKTSAGSGSPLTGTRGGSSVVPPGGAMPGRAGHCGMR
jgi:transposase